MILKTLGGILAYTLIAYATLTRGPSRDFYPLRISPPEATNNIFVFLLLGFALRIAYDIIRWILKLATFPLNRFTLGGVHILLNIAVLYIIPYIIEYLYPSITLSMGTIMEVVLFSIGFGILRSFIK